MPPWPEALYVVLSLLKKFYSGESVEFVVISAGLTTAIATLMGVFSASSIRS